MMTRKHFERLADALASVRPPASLGNRIADFETAQWHDACSAIADMCGNDNPNFDRARFMRACEER